MNQSHCQQSKKLPSKCPWRKGESKRTCSVGVFLGWPPVDDTDTRVHRCTGSQVPNALKIRLPTKLSGHFKKKNNNLKKPKWCQNNWISKYQRMNLDSYTKSISIETIDFKRSTKKTKPQQIVQHMLHNRILGSNECLRHSTDGRPQFRTLVDWTWSNYQIVLVIVVHSCIPSSWQTEPHCQALFQNTNPNKNI